MNPSEQSLLQTASPAVDAIANDPAKSVDPDTLRVIDPDFRAMEVSCIELISKLENCMAKARELEVDDFIDDSATIGQKMMGLLTQFNEEFLSAEASARSTQEIARTMTVSYTYEEILKTRPLTKSLVRIIWNIAESPEIKASHAQLGEAIVRSCAATFYEAVMQIGLNTKTGQEIDQSATVFVNELLESWS